MKYQGKGLSVYTYVVAKIEGEIKVTQLRYLYNAYKMHKKIQFPSYDFEKKTPIWVDVLNLTKPHKQYVHKLKFRNGANVDAFINHRFPIIKINKKRIAKYWKI